MKTVGREQTNMVPLGDDASPCSSAVSQMKQGNMNRRIISLSTLGMTSVQNENMKLLDIAREARLVWKEATEDAVARFVWGGKQVCFPTSGVSFGRGGVLSIWDEEKYSLQYEFSGQSYVRESLVRQKSRIRWAQEGDVNSNVFHVMISYKKRRNMVNALRVGYEWVEDVANISRAAVQYLSKHFFELQWT
ncbi:hypothetical protein RIF29_34828 [Crotalaria pallida]|uniref:Uncharacterized protein n=1 Tax=Crotalaria pallida TaxID=3830 RepID=A0AAN9EBI9_CROPI